MGWQNVTKDVETLMMVSWVKGGMTEIFVQERIQRKAKQKLKMKEAMLSGQHVIIDLDFGAEMTKEQVPTPSRPH